MEREQNMLEKIGIATVTTPVLVLVLALTFPITMYVAWCDVHVWNWFVAPYLHLPAMSFWVMVAVGMFLRTQATDYREFEDAKIKGWPTLLNVTVGHTFAVAVAFAIHHWAARG